MRKLTKRLTVLLLSGMLVFGSVPGVVFAADAQENLGHTSAVAEEVINDDMSEAPASAGETSKESYSEEASAEEAAQYYTVTLDANGGYFENEWDDTLGEVLENTEIINKNIPIGGTVETVPAKESATFLGWSLELDGEILETEYVPVENCTLYAVWQVEEGAELTEEQEDANPAEEIQDESAIDSISEDINGGDSTDTQETGYVDVEEGLTNDAAPVEEFIERDAGQDIPATEDSETFHESANAESRAAEVAEDTELVEGSERVNSEQLKEVSEQDESATVEAEEESVSTDAAMAVVASGECGDSLTWTLDKDGTLTINGTGEMTSAPWTDDYNDTITIVEIGNGVTSIGGWAFEGCTSLTSVTIPNSVTRIGEGSFAGCSSLTRVTIPNSVTSIEWNAFNNCTSLASVTIPDSVISIGDGAFRYCSSLANMTIPDSVTSIGDEAFRYCSSLTRVTLPNSVTRIGDSAFGVCSSLTSMTIPNSVTSIEDFLFEGCTSLTRVTIPNSVTRMGDYAFWNCSSLTSVMIGSSVTSIGEYAFGGCSSLASVTIPDSVTSIGEYAFGGCSSLASVTIPDNVTRMGNHAFAGCSSLTNVTILNSVTSIEDSLFDGCSSLTSVTIPNSVTRIGDYAFDDCSSLTSVTIPDSVTSIGEYAFYGCSSLTSVMIPDSVTSIGAFALDCSDALVIFGMPGSYAEQYAAENNITFYDINSKPIRDASVTIPAQTYNGRAQTPAPVVKIGSTTLKVKTDYIVSYKNNINAGTATVTITGKGNYTGTKTATFKINKATQSITASNLTLTFPKTGTISASGNKGKLTYKSSNTSIATVDSAGKVTAKGAGTAKITITAAATSNYNQATKTITVTVNKAAQSITAKAAASSVAVGKTTTVSLTGNKGSKSFKSSDTSIATVTSAGKVTAKKVGTVKITATSAANANYKAASKTVTIKVVPAATASLTAANQATGIKLTWKKVTGATGYKVYRGSTLIKTIANGSTVTYADSKANNNGTKYTFKIVAKAGTGDSTLSKSVAVYRVARPAISSVTNSAASKMTVKWGKNAKANGYQIQYSTDKNFKSGNKAVSITSASTVSRVIGSLTKGKTYYVRIRTYKTVGSTKYWSIWSAARSVKISK